MKYAWIAFWLLLGQQAMATSEPYKASSEGSDLNVAGVAAEEILQRADEIRAPSESYQMKVSVESSDQPEFQFEISIGGKEDSLIRTLAPKREVGKNYLMQGEHMWAYLPTIRRAIRISLSQKLTGQAANGDISRMRWHGDYKPIIESEDAATWTLFLTAAREGLTYDKMRVVVEKNTFRPKSGQYLSKSGTPLKIIQFLEFSEVAGALRPTQMRIVDAKDSSDYSILKIISMVKQTFPRTVFSEANLR